MRVMINIRNYLMSLPYQMKLIIVFISLILFSISLLGTLTYSQYSSELEKQTNKDTIQLANQVNANLNQYFTQMQIISLSPLYNREIVDILNKYKNKNVYKFPTSTERTKMWRYISSLTHLRPEIKGIQIFTLNGNVFSNVGDNSIDLQMDISKIQNIKEVMANNGTQTIIPAHYPKYYKTDRKVPVISVARLLREPGTNKPIGIIKVDIKLEIMKDLMLNLDLSDGSQLFIVDEKGRLVYPYPNNTQFLQQLNASIEGGKNSDFITLNGTEYKLLYKTSGDTHLKTIMIIPKSKIFSSVHRLSILTVIIAIFCILFVSLLGIILSKPLVSAIYRLRTSMNQVKNGRFDERVHMKFNDEIGQLGEGFNHMMDEINRLVKEVYQVGLKEKDAQLTLLQNQMNPHFLYNTLEHINMMALAKSEYDLSDMVSALGKMLRYSMDIKFKHVSLKEELDFTLAYLKIQQIRLGDKLEFKVESFVNEREIQIPKVIIQPIVENAIKHGLQEKLVINISIYYMRQELIIDIKDNGVGFKESKLKEIYQSFYSGNEGKKTSFQGLGLVNIHERLQLLYGDENRLRIYSKEGQGTTITITIPLREGGENLEERPVG